jgi:hypothetical protein
MHRFIATIVIVCSLCSGLALASQIAVGTVYDGHQVPVVGRSVFVGWSTGQVQYVVETVTGQCGFYRAYFNESSGYPVIVSSATNWTVIANSDFYCGPAPSCYDACIDDYYSGHHFPVLIQRRDRGGDDLVPAIQNKLVDESRTWSALKATFR